MKIKVKTHISNYLTAMGFPMGDKNIIAAGAGYKIKSLSLESINKTISHPDTVQHMDLYQFEYNTVIFDNKEFKARQTNYYQSKKGLIYPNAQLLTLEEAKEKAEQNIRKPVKTNGGNQPAKGYVHHETSIGGYIGPYTVASAPRKAQIEYETYQEAVRPKAEHLPGNLLPNYIMPSHVVYQQDPNSGIGYYRPFYEEKDIVIQQDQNGQWIQIHPVKQIGASASSPRDTGDYTDEMEIDDNITRDTEMKHKITFLYPGHFGASDCHVSHSQPIESTEWQKVKLNYMQKNAVAFKFETNIKESFPCDGKTFENYAYVKHPGLTFIHATPYTLDEMQAELGDADQKIVAWHKSNNVEMLAKSPQGIFIPLNKDDIIVKINDDKQLEQVYPILHPELAQ